MFAKQTLLSASLVAWLGAVPAARADPDASESSSDEAPPRPTGTFTLGGGFSSDEGFIATAAVAQPDLFHTGNYLGLSSRLSATRQQLLLQFAAPRLLGSDYGLDVDLYGDRRVLPGWTRQASGVATTLSHPLGRNLHGFIGYRLERIDVEGAAIAARGPSLGPTLRGGLVSAVRTGLVYSTLDHGAWPRTGTSVGASIEV